MLNKKFKKVVSSVTMFATVVCLSGVSMLAPLSAKAATAIVDGDIIKSNATNSDGTPALSSLDVYIVKIVGTKKFKRLVLNPQVFASYGHLKWGNIKTVSQAEEDSFTTSSLVRVDGSDKVYALTPAGDTGAKSWVNVTATQFIDEAKSDADSIYTINSVDFGNYSAKGDITTVAELKAFYKDGSLPAGTTDGALKVSLAADTAESANIPLQVGVEFAKFNLTASDKGDVTVNSIKLTAGGLDDGDNINDIAVYGEDGARLNSSLRDISGDEAIINLGGLKIEAGDTETITVKASVYKDSDHDSSAAEGIYSLGIDSKEDVSSDATDITGSFPVEGNEMNAVLASGLAELTFAADGSSLSSVDLGDEEATIAKFKVTGDVADATIDRIALKRDSSVANAASDDAVENLALYADGKKVAEADEITNKYVTFDIEDGVAVEDGDTVKFVVKADIVGGAGKKIALSLDNGIDVDAMGKKYPAMIVDDYPAEGVSTPTASIEGGAVTLEKVDADPLKVKVDTENVELGTIKVTGNSGEAINIESLGVNIAVTTPDTDDDTANTENNTDSGAFNELTNIEIYDATDKSTYDLDYSGTGTSTKLYKNSDINIEMESGETHELIVRGDTNANSNGNTYTVSLSSSNLTIKEIEDDTAITDITPSTVTLKKVTVESSGISFAVKALSTSLTAVAGKEDVEAIRFTAKANASDATITELQFANDVNDDALNSSLVSGFTLYNGDGTKIKEVGTSALSGEEVTFDDLDIEVKADQTKTFYVTLDLVSDSGNRDKTIQLELSGYSAEDADDDVYDTANDSNSDGDIVAGTLRSARTITVAGVGALAVSIDNSLSDTDSDIYAVAGTDAPKLAALKLKASNENVEVTKIVATLTGITAAQAASIFSNLKLVDEAGTTVATAETIGATVTFDDFTFVAGTAEKYLYLKGTLNKIGENEVGVLDETDITFKFGGIEANGESSGTDLVAATTHAAGQSSLIDAGKIAYDYDGDGYYNDADDTTATTAVSKQFGSLATRISSVELVNSGDGYTVGSKLSSGEQIVGILKVTTDASANTTSTGSTAKTALSQVVVDISKLSAANGTAITAATIQNSSSSSTTAATAGSIATCEAADTTSSLIFNVTGTDYEIAPSSTKYFLIKATVTMGGTGSSDDYLQAKLGHLDATDATANFTWKDSISASSSKNAMRLGYTSVSGTTLSE